MTTQEKPYIGLDYGHGLSNVNHETGIRYGVISIHSLGEWVFSEAEPIYPDSVEVECEGCGTTFETDNLCPDDYQTCPECGHEQTFRDLELLEPIGWDYCPNDEQYTTESSESLMAVFITKSPYFTYGAYCSPCAPGAVDLDTPLKPDEGHTAYCFGHDMFGDDGAPYDVYSVETGDLVPVPEA